MSSEIEGVAVIAAAVALPAVAAFGAGWLAWQSGKLLLGANAAIDREIEERQRVRQEAQRQRKLAAAAARQHLAAACAGVLEELDTLDGIGPADRESIRQELRQICEAPVPDSAEGMESMNALDAMRLERILDRQNTLKKVRLSGSGTYDGLAVADDV